VTKVYALPKSISISLSDCREATSEFRIFRHRFHFLDSVLLKSKQVTYNRNNVFIALKQTILDYALYYLYFLPPFLFMFQVL